MFTDWTDLDGICRSRMLDKFIKSESFPGFLMETWSDGSHSGETHTDLEGFQSTGFRYYRLTREVPTELLRLPRRLSLDV